MLTFVSEHLTATMDMCAHTFETRTRCIETRLANTCGRSTLSS